MLTLTENAATAVKEIVGRGPEVEGTGLRIKGADDPTGGFTLTLSGPEPADEVIENAGARVFLDPVASDALSERVLDARVDDQGGVRFELG